MFLLEWRTLIHIFTSGLKYSLTKGLPLWGIYPPIYPVSLQAASSIDEDAAADGAIPVMIALPSTKTQEIKV
jgi:hypothetical protein